MARLRTRFPHFPIWVDDFLGDTAHLNARETGAYFLLILAAWRTDECALPNDDAKLARWARCSPTVWQSIRPSVMAFWQTGEDGLFRQKRLTRVREEVYAKYLKTVQAGQASALKRLQSYTAGVDQPFQRPFNGRTNETATNQNQNQRVSVSSNLTVAARDAAPERSRSAPRAKGPSVKERTAEAAKLHRLKTMGAA